MKEKKIRLYNGPDWVVGRNRGRLFVGAHNAKDAVALANEAYRKVTGKDWDFLNLYWFDLYWFKGLWGGSMAAITPERGVWREEEYDTGRGLPPKRIL